MLRDKSYLVDILESARLAVEHVGGMTLDDFLNDIQCQDAVIRRFEILGEAARRISFETQEYFPQLPWPDMIRMRNLLIHEYDNVDMNIVYETVLTDLPPLIATIENILRNF